MKELDSNNREKVILLLEEYGFSTKEYFCVKKITINKKEHTIYHYYDNSFLKIGLRSGIILGNFTSIYSQDLNFIRLLLGCLSGIIEQRKEIIDYTNESLFLTCSFKSGILKMVTDMEKYICFSNGKLSYYSKPI